MFALLPLSSSGARHGAGKRHNGQGAFQGTKQGSANHHFSRAKLSLPFHERAGTLSCFSASRQLPCALRVLCVTVLGSEVVCQTWF
jgi:hypothetical protein